MDILGAQLQTKGYDTRTWGLKIVNAPNVSVGEDSILLAEGILKPLIEQQGKDVVLYLHSTLVSWKLCYCWFLKG